MEFNIITPQQRHWNHISSLIARSIPNAMVSHLGTDFGAAYYQNISQNDNVCCLMALDSSENVAGVIIAVLDRNTVRKISKYMSLKLIFKANFRLLSPTVLKWLFKGIITKISGENRPITFPNAELIVIAVLPEFRGTTLAYELINKMEEFFKMKGVKNTYLILTEKNNFRANRFYSKIGAELIGSHHHHGRQINEWHKKLV
jgi:ribosomal protein S18 acetylase RimI-like enzyme